MPTEYRRFWITAPDALERERLLAEAFESGAEGAEERDEEVGFRACIYASSEQIETVRSSVARGASPATQVDASEPMPEVDWSEAWKDGIEAQRVSERLLIRPPFVDVELEPGQVEIVIDPGQAFGTGSHASTRLSLEWIDVLLAEKDAPRRFDRVLDVGTGSGVLALAARKLGVREAVGFDLDAVAIEAAREAARSNGLAEGTRFLAAGIQEIDAEGAPAAPFPLVVANLLKREIMPIASEVAARLERDGCLVLSGLLEEDGPEVRARFEQEGLVELAAPRTVDDSTGRWIGLCLGRR